MVHKNAWLVSAKLDLFLYQTYSEILSVFPETGSLGGKTDIIITGDFFDNPALVTIAGVPCDIRHMSPRKIECTTRAPGKRARLTAPQAGNRGLLFEVGEAVEGLDLTVATPGYRWQIVPNASSPFGFWFKEGQPFRARLSGFFVAPETNNYTFWIQADNQASLYFSQSEDPRMKVKVASIRVGTADWFDAWEQDRNEGVWQRKTPKLELVGGTRYYLEAEHYGRTPSRGMRIGVQIHNTWLNPDVVSTYLREKHQIRVRAQRLPEIQMLTVSGRGSFFLTWDNVTSEPIPENATAHQIQTAIEELLAVKCKLEPLSANILLWLGFEQGPEGSSFEGDLTSGTEPFCGRFSLHQPRRLVLTPPAAQKDYWLDRYTHLCIAYKGRMKNILKVTVFFTTDFQNFIKKNITCDWNLVGTRPNSWQFTCTDLWETCVHHSMYLQPPLVDSPVLVHRIDLFPLSQETSGFYVDEIIIADTNITVSQADSETAHPGGNLVESLCVVGSPPVYNISFWLVGCGQELPLITASIVPTGGEARRSGLVQVTTQRIQKTSPPLGGYFHIQLPTSVIPDVPVHISASHLRKLLQNNADNFTSRYLNSSDLTWTLSWSSQVGDLPNFIRVSDANLTGVNPAATVRVVYDGGVFLGPVFGDMLVTANQHTQVVVRVNDIPAHCSGSCSFQYLEGSTPQIHSAWYSLDGDISLLIYIFGINFSGDPQALEIMVNKTNCKVIFSNQTNVICQTDLLPVGMHRLFMVVRPFGRAINTSGEALFLSVEPRLDAVEPSRAAEIGGLWATIQGSGLEDVSLVLFGSQSCAINITTSNSRRIQCRVPPRGKDGPVVNLTVVSGDHSAVLPMAFTYVSSLNPVITSLSRNRSNIAGGDTLFIRMALLVNYTDLDVEVCIQNTLAPAHVQMPQGLEVVLPPLPAGLYSGHLILNKWLTIIAQAISAIHICFPSLLSGSVLSQIHVSLSCTSIPLFLTQLFYNNLPILYRVDLHIQYITEVFSIEPCCGSLLVQVDLLGPFTCVILSLGHQTILCQINKVNDSFPDVSFTLNVTVIVNGLPSECQGNCTLFLQEETTPIVDSLTTNISGSLTMVLIRGRKLGITAVEPMVFVDDHLPCIVTFFNASYVICWISDLTPGLHYVSVFHARNGYACFGNVSRHFYILPQVFHYFPKNFSIHGGSLLTVEGTALRGKNSTLVYVGQQACLTVSISTELIQCIVPAGNGSVGLVIEVDGLSYQMGVIGYSSAFTPRLLSISQTDDVLTFAVAQVSGAENVDIFIGMSPCVGISGNHTVLQCVVSSLPAGEYPVRGYDRMRGWASSVLICVYNHELVFCFEGCLGGRLVHVFGAGFSPGNVSAAVCGAPCQVLANATVSAFSCLVLPLNVSLAFLCGLKHSEESCEASSSTYVQCDLTVTVGTETLPQSWPYLYICEESPQCLFAPDHWTESTFPWFSGLFISPKVERDEVLIYNSSCNIAMETEAKMECETPNQPITAKITEIRKSRGQSTQV
uniref:PA14 domain-containing protein n=1 Tax=Canis lupus dingo TaxID=286419 RepID=A0A8C0KK16_CANLU